MAAPAQPKSRALQQVSQLSCMPFVSGPQPLLARGAVQPPAFIVDFCHPSLPPDQPPALPPQLAANADLYVNDAFGTAHRAHASTEGVTKYLKPSVAGFLLQKVRGGAVVVVLGCRRECSGCWALVVGAAVLVGGSRRSSRPLPCKGADQGRIGQRR
jgi:hypothetical protein